MLSVFDVRMVIYGSRDANMKWTIKKHLLQALAELQLYRYRAATFQWKYINQANIYILEFTLQLTSSRPLRHQTLPSALLYLIDYSPVVQESK